MKSPARTVRGIAKIALLSVVLGVSANASAGVFVSVTIAPPPLPVYVQPMCPGPGYIWTPGYWAWDDFDGDYYWVPGTWVIAPTVGYLWTPGYWGWADGVYIWHTGYWGPHVGFYGGVNYGYGYGGVGFVGGRWERNVFVYNRAVSNVDVKVIHNTYNTTVVNNVTVNRVSYNGGNGGTTARASARERMAERDSHVAATGLQVQHEQTAQQDRSLRASVNHGRPEIAATPRAAEFRERGAVSASAPDRAERQSRVQDRPSPQVRRNPPPAVDVPSARDTGPTAAPAPDRAGIEESRSRRNRSLSVPNEAPGMRDPRVPHEDFGNARPDMDRAMNREGPRREQRAQPMCREGEGRREER